MSTHEFTTGLSFLPLQFQDAPLRMGLDAEGNIDLHCDGPVKALGYRDPANALRLLDDDEQGYSNLSTLRGLQRVLYVTESGFYHLIFGSRGTRSQRVSPLGDARSIAHVAPHWHLHHS